MRARQIGGSFFMATKLQQDILDRKQKAQDYLRVKRDFWTEYENLFHGYLTDDLSSKTKSQMFDPKLATIALDRSARVMAQLPTGKVKGISKNDMAGEQLMNMILDKYVVPNANAQFDFLTKCRMMNLYSNIYGNFFGLVDWVADRGDGYVGPDLWLLNIRDVFPQVGATSLEDSDYCIVRSWKPISYFEGLAKQKGYKNINEIVNKLKDMSSSKDRKGQEDTSSRESNDYPDETAAKQKGYFEVLSQYEKDRWVDLQTDTHLEFRDINNPHDNGELPLVNKYSIPLLGDFMGMGDFERGKSQQYGINSLWNLYLDAVKVSIFPPVLVNEDNVSDQSSIKWAAAAKWLMKGPGGVQGAQTLNLSPQGIAEFNQVYGAMNASLLNMFGTTDTTTTSQSDPGFGKTPQALKMQANRENARDTVDRFYTEMFMTKVMKKFVNLISKKMTGSIAIRMFGDEITQLGQEYPEFKQMFDEKTGKLNIPKSKFGSVLYDYDIVSGSTYAADKDKQTQSLISLFSLMTQNMVPNPQTGEVTSPLLDQLKKENKSFMFGEALTRIISSSGIQDWDKIVIDTKNDIQAKMQADMQKFTQIMQGMQAQNTSQVPTPPIQPQVPGQQVRSPMPPQGTPTPQNVPVQRGQMPPQMPNGVGGIPNVG
jgi:hypothetical protein